MLLLFFLLCFIGLGFMFYCIMRKQDAILTMMREDHAQFKLMLRAMETRISNDNGYEYAEAQSDEFLNMEQEKAKNKTQNKNMPELKF